MSIIRFVVVAIILSTSIYAILSDTNLTNSNPTDSSMNFFNKWGFSIALPVLLSANFYHNALPNNFQYTENKKKNIPLIFNASVVTATLIFISLGLIVPAATNNIEAMLSLN